MNLNDLARNITLAEGLKESISIAQVKEVLAIVLRMLAGLPPEELEKILRRYRRRT